MAMNKQKLALIALFLVVLLPSLFAIGSSSSSGQDGSETASSKSFVWVVSLILGNANNTNEALIKLAMFAIVFGVFVKGMGSYFREFPFGTKIIAFLIAIVGIRLMPDMWIMSLGKLIWVAAIIVVPYLIVNMLVPDFSILKVCLLAVAYFGAYLLVAGNGFWGMAFLPGLYSDFYYFYSVYFFQTAVVITSIICYFAWKWYRQGKKG